MGVLVGGVLVSLVVVIVVGCSRVVSVLGDVLMIWLGWWFVFSSCLIRCSCCICLGGYRCLLVVLCYGEGKL